MNLADFSFDLPYNLIAQKPAHPRDHARLLVYNRQTKTITDDFFYNLDKYLNSSTTLVLNNSKVEKCRYLLGNIEVFVLQTVNPTTARALIRPGRKFKEGSVINVKGIELKVNSVEADGSRIIQFDRPLDDASLQKFRHTPFPPYIHAGEKLAAEYQTVYADPLGSKAAPTAGLHFTDKLLNDLSKTHPIAQLTLHVGLGTFAPIREEDLGSDKLHTEQFELNADNAQILNNAKHVTAVGTTSCRVLESLVRPIKPVSSSTNIFIKPGYQFSNVNSLITNFHLPGSSLIMLVAAFMGSVEEMQRAYAYAIDCQYRFFSFGDAMLII